MRQTRELRNYLMQRSETQGLVRGRWNKMTFRVSWSRVGLVLLLICCLFLLLQLGNWDNICGSPSCVDLANKLHEAVDTTVNPCDDFYQFSCGNYIRTTVIPNYKNTWGHRSEIDENIYNILYKELTTKDLEDQPPVFQKAKDFFYSCMDTAMIEKIGLKDMKKRLRSYGGWPVLDDNWNDRHFNWIDVTKKLLDAGQPYYMVVNFRVTSNEKNVTQPVLTLDPPAFGYFIGIDSYHLLNGTDDPVTKAYYEEMVNIAVEFGANRATAQRELRESLHFEMQIANISYEDQDLEDFIPKLHIMKISEIQKKYPYLDWLSFYTTVLGKSANISADDLVQISSSLFLRKLGSLLAKTPKRVLANYMLWQVVFSSKRHLNHYTDELNYKLLSVRFSLPKSVDRKMFCLIKLKTEIPSILGAMFVRKYFSPRSKEKATEIVKLLQNQLLKVITEVDWLDSVTRQRALEKVKSTQLFVGYPDELLDDEYLNKYFEKLTINRTNFYSNILNINKFQIHKRFNELHGRINTSSWDKQGLQSLVEWMAFNMYRANGLDIYAGLLQGFYFDSNRPLFLNIASVGGIIAHEFTHSIDVLGAHIDKDGNVRNWWEKETKLTFNEKAEAIVNEYSTYKVKELNISLNAVIMQDEIIADHGGYKVARRALEDVLPQLTADPRLVGFETYSARQMFWIVLANGWCTNMRPDALRSQITYASHPPSEFRVNGPFRNSPQFSEDWKCPLGSYMNPKNKVNVW